MKWQRALSIYALPDSDDEVRMKPIELKMSYKKSKRLPRERLPFLIGMLCGIVMANVYCLIKGPMRTVTHLVKME